MRINPESRHGFAVAAVSLPLALSHLILGQASQESMTPAANHHPVPVQCLQLSLIAPKDKLCIPTPSPFNIPPPSSESDLSSILLAKTAVQKLSPMAKLKLHYPGLVQDFERVAPYESGSNWKANTGNGYYGGLQFSAGTWTSFDIENFAPRADLATKAQQIRVAIRTLDAQGWGAWPVTCHEANVC